MDWEKRRVDFDQKQMGGAKREFWKTDRNLVGVRGKLSLVLSLCKVGFSSPLVFSNSVLEISITLILDSYFCSIICFL